MRRFEFVAGYYEWGLFANGELIHSFEDFSENITDNMNAKDIGVFVEDLIYMWQEDCQVNGGYCPIDEKEIPSIKTVMQNEICYHFGIERFISAKDLLKHLEELENNERKTQAEINEPFENIDDGNAWYYSDGYIDAILTIKDLIRGNNNESKRQS